MFFFIVLAPGEVKDATRGKCVTCHGIHSFLEKDTTVYKGDSRLEHDKMAKLRIAS